MIDVLLNRFRRLHMVGIGGSGMSGIAEVLIKSGLEVSGCDLQENEATRRLRDSGAEVIIGHDAKHLMDADAVIYSTAVRESHPEIVAARERRLPLIPRAEMLAELMRMKAGVAISGTHGKTTTTSLVGEVLSAGGLEPTVIVGGRLRKLGGSGVTGGGEFLVVEADEFERSFLRLTPALVVITNIDSDHLECYGSYEALEDAFVQFGNSVPFYGRAIVCSDEPSIAQILPRLTRTVVTYGFSDRCDVRASDVRHEQMHTRFVLQYDGSREEINLPLPGRHNVLNALAAAAVGRELGLKVDAIRIALERFRGVHRRFEIVGEANGILVVDDFGHHPAEIAATLAAARNGWNRPIIAVFQPHLFSRTRDLAVGFAQALAAADRAIVLPIYPAREDPIPGVTSKLIVDAAHRSGNSKITYLENRADVTKELLPLAKSGDMVLTIGAGDVYKLAPQILKALRGGGAE